MLPVPAIRRARPGGALGGIKHRRIVRPIGERGRQRVHVTSGNQRGTGAEIYAKRMLSGRVRHDHRNAREDVGEGLVGHAQLAIERRSEVQREPDVVAAREIDHRVRRDRDVMVHGDRRDARAGEGVNPVEIPFLRAAKQRELRGDANPAQRRDGLFDATAGTDRRLEPVGAEDGGTRAREVGRFAGSETCCE